MLPRGDGGVPRLSNPLWDERVREIRGRLGELIADSQAILERAEAESRDLSRNEQKRFDDLHAEISTLRKRIENEERHANVDRDLSRPLGSRRTEDPGIFGQETSQISMLEQNALRAWALGKRASRAQIEAAAELGINHMDPQLELRSLNSVTATQGQATIPDEMMRSLIDVQKWFGSVRSAATVIQTETGAPLPVPKGDDTSNTGEIVADSGAVTTTDDPSFDQVVLKPYKFSSKAVIVSVELLQDAAVNLAQYLGRKLGQRIGRIQNNKFTVGTGTNEPKGIVVASALGKTASATNDFEFDELIDLKHSVDPAYRSMPGCGWMMSDTVFAYTRKLKDSQNRYLWELSTVQGPAPTLEGYPVLLNNDMATAFTTGQKLALFGHLPSYTIQDAGPITLIRADELFVLNHQVAFLAFQRSDGNLPDTTAVKHLKLA
jgi:HK97 family phage major capsid protein